MQGIKIYAMISKNILCFLNWRGPIGSHKSTLDQHRMYYSVLLVPKWASNVGTIKISPTNGEQLLRKNWNVHFENLSLSRMSPEMLTAAEWKADAIGPVIMAIFILVALLFLLHHFKDHKGLSKEVKLFAVFSHVFPITLCSFHSIIGTNALFPNMMGLRQYVDTMTPYGCANLLIAQVFVCLFTRYCMISFSLSKLRHFFVSPSLQLNIKIYYGWMLSFGVLILMIFFYSMSNVTDGWIISAIDDENIKRCALSESDDKVFFIGFAFYILVIEGVMQSVLLYLYYRKCRQFRKMYLEINIDDKYVKKHVVWRSMILGIIAIISSWINGIFIVIFQTHSLIRGIADIIMSIIQILSITLSFDICSCRNGNTNGSDVINRQNGDNRCMNIELTSDQDEYLSRIMEAYYRNPTKNHTEARNWSSRAK